MWILDDLAKSVIVSIVSSPIIAFLSFLVYRISREIFRGKFYKALFSALGIKNPKNIERYRLKHYVKHSFVLESAEVGDEALSYRQFIKKIKNTKFVILMGSAGIGKSKLMQRLALQFRTHYHKGTTGEGIQNYGILFYKLTGDYSVKEIVDRVKGDSKNSQNSYTLFLDGLDEMSGIQTDGGDKVLKELVRTLNKEVSGNCKTIFISLRPEILGKGFSFSEEIRDAEIAIFKIANFNEQQILTMYRNESWISKNKHDETWKKIGVKTRRENIKKLKTVVKNNPESVFTYPLILTWANEILSRQSVENLQHISWYAALGEVIQQELTRECSLYYKTINSDSPNEKVSAQFVKDGTDFLKELAIKMALSNKKQLTAAEILEGTVAKQLVSAYGKTSIVARHLLRYIDWSEKGGPIYYEFLHNTIYWRALAEVLLDPNTPQESRAQIILQEEENQFSTPLLQYCRQGLRVVSGEETFPDRSDNLADRGDAEEETMDWKTNGNDVPLDVVCTCCFGLNEVKIDGLLFNSTRLQEFIRNRKLDLSYFNVQAFAFLKNFSDKSFDVLDCSYSSVEDVVIPNYVKEVNFEGCENLRSISFFDDSCLSKIGRRAFAGCVSLASMEIPKNVTSIGEEAFSGCIGITSITIPDGVMSIGRGAFSDCVGITRVNYGGDLKTWCEVWNKICFLPAFNRNPLCAAKGKAKLYVHNEEVAGEVEIPAGTQIIGQGAFHNLKGITSVTIPDSVRLISWSAFFGCAGLQKVILGAGVTNIFSSAFLCCFGLQTITIGEKVKRIDAGAFCQCRSLTRIDYQGTTQQWLELQKGFMWNSGTGEYTVYCTDGTVSKDGAVTPYEA